VRLLVSWPGCTRPGHSLRAVRGTRNHTALQSCILLRTRARSAHTPRAHNMPCKCRRTEVWWQLGPHQPLRRILIAAPHPSHSNLKAGASSREIYSPDRANHAARSYARLIYATDTDLVQMRRVGHSPRPLTPLTAALSRARTAGVQHPPTALRPPAEQVCSVRPEEICSPRSTGPRPECTPTRSFTEVCSPCPRWYAPRHSHANAGARCQMPSTKCQNAECR
jgi:hypothetical protein